jgi:Ca2+-binding EF-hand superfamily protein
MVDTSRYAATFDIVDADNDGRISAEELKALMSAMGEEITGERADEMVRQIDTDGNGTICLEEFAAFMSGRSDS